MNRTTCVVLVFALALLVWGDGGGGQRCAAADGPRPRAAWADERLPATPGLRLWLDASRLNVARRSQSQPPLADGDAVEAWPDAAGSGAALTQADEAARPRFVADDAYQAVRFDGEKAFLGCSTDMPPLDELTLFIVAVPFSNPGEFRAVLAANETGKNDYVTGLTVDQGPWLSPQLQVLNVEGAGFVGARNLLAEPAEFAAVQRWCVTSAVGQRGTRLFSGGKLQGERERAASQIHVDEFRVGARYYDHGRPPQVRGFFDGDVLEVLLYDRVLSDEQRTEVDRYLVAKYGEARAPLPMRHVPGKPLVAVPDPPAVQMFVPGFTVRELPVELTNINNVLYRADGKLLALAYNGRVYLLSDTDGDGLEDKVETFWDNPRGITGPIGMALTPPGYPHGNGLFLACKGKCLLVVDTDGDDRADKEIVVAEGWNELPHGVDALGVAFDERDGSVYFGLGCTNFTSPYLVGPNGKAAYSLTNERGTILRVAPDFQSREIVATGIRFPVGLRFSPEGELFCTDQEGATWLSNGNPFDELLHVQRGRHYGFPPRHPLHLPDVIDEPSVVDYRPQHQSLCGFNFNAPVNGGPTFGPDWWRSDLLLAGYSRGKLYRTKLVSTAAGYVGQPQLLAALNKLPSDVCITPRGEIVVAVHSGGPDWGSGPQGEGKLYKIAYSEPDLPQPVFAWPQGPQEVRIAFDRPLELEHVKRLAGRTAIEYGRYVAAGDRFESLRPGYKVVHDQLRTPRYELPILSIQLLPDRRTLLMATARHAAAMPHAISLPGLGRDAASQTDGTTALHQVPETDLAYELSGIDVRWQSADGVRQVATWLPHLDLNVARALTVPSAPHQELWEAAQTPGTLTLATKLNLKDMLRPAVQPGSTIDYQWPDEDVTVVLRSRQPLEVKAPAAKVSTDVEAGGQHRTSLTVKSAGEDLLPLEVALATDSGEVDLRVTYSTREDPRERAFPLWRFELPWAPQADEDGSTMTVPESIPELAGGNWSRGRAVFHSTEAQCAKCHRVGGEGGQIGPDLSNLPQRDYHSVLRDISQPSYAINPDHVTQLVRLLDGRVLTGVVRTDGDQLHVGGLDGQVTVVRRDDVEQSAVSPKSTMPDDIVSKLGPDKTRDLLTFLLSQPPRMPDYGKQQPPPPRSPKDVEAVLAGAKDEPTRPIEIVLVAGAKDHGPGEHDYPAWQKVWQRLLSMAEKTTVATADEWPSDAQLQTADVLVFYQRGTWNAERAKAIDAFLARGGGLVYIHYAVDGGDDAPGFAKRIGLAWQGGRSLFRHGPLELGFQTGQRHPIARNFDKVHFHDESYWRLTGDPQSIAVLATGEEQGQPQPLFWTTEPARGRVFVSIPGHFMWTFDDPLFRVLLLRGMAWSAGEPVDRFNDLVTPGARIEGEPH
jgi:putative heme-binding domain-containing protein